MNLENIRNNKVGTILQFSIPSIIAMILTSLITVTDGFFIGNYVGENGLAAVNLGLPIVYLFLAVGLMVSVGGAAITGMALGGKEIKKCKDVFNQTMSTVVVISILLSIIVWFCLRPMLYFLNADRAVGELFVNYYGIMLLELPLMVINASFGMFVRGEGKPQYFMQANILNVVLNALLDYLFVARFGWGVKGAAAASLLAITVTLLFLLRFFVKISTVYKIGRFSFSGSVLKDTLLNGGSEFIGEMSLCISMFAYNFVILKHVGLNGVTAFTIAGYLAFIFSMIQIGFGQGASPLISFSYGAQEHRLAASIRRITSFMVLAAGAVVFLFVLIGSGGYSGLFVKSTAVRELVESGMIIFALSFLFSGVNVISSFYFTSIGKAKESAMISSARGLILLLICIFTLPVLWGMTGVWLVAPITELVTVCLSLFFINRDAHCQKGINGIN